MDEREEYSNTCYAELLRERVKESGYTVPEFVSRIGISLKSWYSKTKDHTQFTRYEIGKIRELLELTADEVCTIFFD